MKKLLIKLLAITVLTAFVAGSVQAQDKKEGKPAAAGEHKKAPNGMPFHGKLSAVDANAKTISVAGKEKDRTFQVTSQTKITKDGKPATLADAKAGDEVGGFAREGAEGKMELVSLRVGPKPTETKGEHKKKEAK